MLSTLGSAAKRRVLERLAATAGPIRASGHSSRVSSSARASPTPRAKVRTMVASTPSSRRDQCM